MKPDEVVVRVLAITGGGLVVAQTIFGGYAWWPAFFNIPSETQRGYTLGLTLLVLGAIAYFMWGEWKYRSPHVYAENFKANLNPTTDRIHSAGPYGCLPYGGVNSNGISLKGRDGTIVAPKDAIRYWGDQVRIDSYLKPVSLDELPASAQRTIVRDRLPTDELWLDVGPSFIEAHAIDHAERVLEKLHENRISTTVVRASQAATQAMELDNRNMAARVENMNKPTFREDPRQWVKSRLLGNDDKDQPPQ